MIDLQQFLEGGSLDINLPGASVQHARQSQPRKEEDASQARKQRLGWSHGRNKGERDPGSMTQTIERCENQGMKRHGTADAKAGDEQLSEFQARRAPFVKARKELVSIERRVAAAVGRYEEASQNVLLNLVEMDSGALPVVYKNQKEMMLANKVRIDTFLHKQSANRKRQQNELHDASRTLNKLQNVLDRELNPHAYEAAKTAFETAKDAEEKRLVEEALLQARHVLEFELDDVARGKAKAKGRMEQTIGRISRHVRVLVELKSRTGDQTTDQHLQYLESKSTKQYQEILRLRSSLSVKETELRDALELEKKSSGALSAKLAELEEMTSLKEDLSTECGILRKRTDALQSQLRDHSAFANHTADEDGDSLDDDDDEDDNADVNISELKHQLKSAKRYIAKLNSGYVKNQDQNEQLRSTILQLKHKLTQAAASSEAEDLRRGQQSIDSAEPASDSSVGCEKPPLLDPDGVTLDLRRDLFSKEQELESSKRLIESMKEKHLEMVQVSFKLIEKEGDLTNKLTSLEGQLRRKGNRNRGRGANASVRTRSSSARDSRNGQNHVLRVPSVIAETLDDAQGTTASDDEEEQQQRGGEEEEVVKVEHRGRRSSSSSRPSGQDVAFLESQVVALQAQLLEREQEHAQQIEARLEEQRKKLQGQFREAIQALQADVSNDGDDSMDDDEQFREEGNFLSEQGDEDQEEEDQEEKEQQPHQKINECSLDATPVEKHLENHAVLSEGFQGGVEPAPESDEATFALTDCEERETVDVTVAPPRDADIGQTHHDKMRKLKAKLSKALQSLRTIMRDRDEEIKLLKDKHAEELERLREKLEDDQDDLLADLRTEVSQAQRRAESAEDKLETLTKLNSELIFMEQVNAEMAKAKASETRQSKQAPKASEMSSHSADLLRRLYSTQSELKLAQLKVNHLESVVRASAAKASKATEQARKNEPVSSSASGGIDLVHMARLSQRVEELEQAVYTLGSSRNREPRRAAMSPKNTAGHVGFRVSPYVVRSQPRESRKQVQDLQAVYRLFTKMMRETIEARAQTNWTLLARAVVLRTRQAHLLSRHATHVVRLVQGWQIRGANIAHYRRDLLNNKVAQLEGCLAKSLRSVWDAESFEEEPVASMMPRIDAKAVMLQLLLGPNPSSHVLPIQGVEGRKAPHPSRHNRDRMVQYGLSASQLERLVAVAPMVPQSFHELSDASKRQVLADVVNFVNFPAKTRPRTRHLEPPGHVEEVTDAGWPALSNNNQVEDQVTLALEDQRYPESALIAARAEIPVRPQTTDPRATGKSPRQYISQFSAAPSWPGPTPAGVPRVARPGRPSTVGEGERRR